MRLKKLIDNDGKIIYKQGYANEGIGIFDNDNTAYPAGIDANGNLYASNVDKDNNILTLDSDSILPGNWKL